MGKRVPRPCTSVTQEVPNENHDQCGKETNWVEGRPTLRSSEPRALRRPHPTLIPSITTLSPVKHFVATPVRWRLGF